MADYSSLDILLGKKICSINENVDTVSIQFSENIRLTIYNKYSFESCSPEEICNDEIISITEQNKNFVFTFRNSGKLAVSMSYDAYLAPEAMQLRVPDKPIMIWN